jgi:hypothetical protein
MTNKMKFKRTGLRVLCIGAAIFSTMTYAQETPAVSAATPEPAAAVTAATVKKKDKLFIIGRIQMRAMSGQSDTAWSTGNGDYNLVDFNFRRLRFGAIYEGDKHWGMIVNVRLENALNKTYLTSSGTKEVLHDNRGMIQEANAWYKFDFLGTRLVLGMVNVPFNREFLTSSSNLINVERAMATNAVQQFDNGFRIDFHPLGTLIGKKYENNLELSGMIGTGHGGAGDYGYGRRVDTQELHGAASGPASPFFYGRAQYNVFGGAAADKPWKEGDEVFQKDLKISVGAGFMGTQESKITTGNLPEFQATSVSMPLTTASGSNNCAALASGTNCSMFGQTYDLTATYAHLYVNGMYQYYGGPAGQNLSGYTVTTGYNIPVYGESYLMPVVRFDFMKGDFGNSTGHTNTTGMSSDPANQFNQLWVGLNLFHSKHDFKLQLYYRVLGNNYKGYDAAGSALGGYSQNMFIFQAQANFKTGVGI